MDEEQVPIPPPGNAEAVDEGVNRRSPEKRHDVGNGNAEADSSPSVGPVGQRYTSLQPRAGVHPDEDKTGAAEPPVDWFEPLEDDDDEEVYGGVRNYAEDESLAGESERSESVAGSEKASKRLQNHQPRRRKRVHPDEGWEEWPVLGFGWKRREVIRRSGSSMGQTDVYYLSPQGERVRSRPGLVSVMKGQLDLSGFDFKSGRFFEGSNPPIKVRKRVKKKVKEWSSTESSSAEQDEDGDPDTPDSYHRLTPNQSSKHPTVKDAWRSKPAAPNQGVHRDNGEEKPTLPLPSSSRLLPLLSVNGDLDPEKNSLVCARCGVAFIGTWYDKQRKKPCCPSCWDASKSREHPMIRFRKWFPCGECVACRNTINCGQCHNCTNGMHHREARKRICQKRKCMFPVRRKDPGREVAPQQDPVGRIPDVCEDSRSVKSENTDSQLAPTLKNSDADNLTLNIDLDDDDDLSTDDDDDWHKKRKRRSCGECKACLCRKDCGTCDFCIDKPKFGGINKKRQKCRLRQCQRQAMRHLLPFQLEEQGENGPEPASLPGRPRIHYTYSRKSTPKKSKGPSVDSPDEDEDDDDRTMQPSSWRFENNEDSKRHYDINLKSHQSSMQQLNHSSIIMRNGLSERVPPIRHHHSPRTQLSRKQARSSLSDDPKEVVEDSDEDDLPMITNVFSCADAPLANNTDCENQLMKLLHSLRANVLPIMWYAILVEGPQVQLIQCSKQSSMSDTMVLIDPGLCYQVTVQKQPLMPTHPIYDVNPLLLTTVAEVVTLLLGLEKYIVCQGIPQREPSPNREPIMLERAAICEFLVEKNVGICSNCRQLQKR